MKKIQYIFLAFASFCLATACTDDLNQKPHTESTAGAIYTSVDGYRSVLAKLYTSFVTAGQEQGGNNPDLSSNSGYDYLRCYFNMQQAGTDEIASTWLSGDNIANLTYLSWDANDPWVADTYYRIYYTITLCNEFLRNAKDENFASFTDDETTLLKNFRAEARFLRALAYYHAMDLYRNIPYVDENDPVGKYYPPQKTSAEIFEFIESELIDIDEDLLSRSECEYGRAPKAAAYALMARLYLNAEVYTGTARYTDCIIYCKKVIDEGYTLEDEYAKLFNADNHLRTNEIIFSFPVDAVHTVSWGATTYIVCGAVSNTSDYQIPATYGVESGWGMFRVRGEIPALFESNDSRAMFFTEGQSQYLNAVDDQTNGFFVEKWTNLTDSGVAASNTAVGGVNTDFPVFRLADVYLMLAESVARNGQGYTLSEAVGFVNLLRERAYGNTSGNITASALTADFCLDERARELYWECTRRTDLIRHGKFTTSAYLWQWKGGTQSGRAVDDKYNIYPKPATDLSANSNLSNIGY